MTSKFNYKLNDIYRAKLRAYANSHGISIADAIRRAIDYFLEAQKEKK